MTQPPNVALEPVTFERRRDEGSLAVYLALVEDSAGSGTVFSLTATTNAPGEGPQAAALLQSLNEIRAEFSVLDKPGPSDPVTMEPEPFNPATEVMIELGVAKYARAGSVSFDVKLQATIAAGGTVTVRGGKRQRWHSKGGKAWATVKVIGGAGTIDPQVKLLPDPNNNHKFESGVQSPNEYEAKKSDTVILGTAKVMTYILFGNSFTLPLT